MRLSPLLSVLLLPAGLLFAAPASAAPASDPAPVQTRGGAANGTTFTASLQNNPRNGNSIVVVVGLDHAAAVEADDVSNVIEVAESGAAFGVAGAPYVLTFAAEAHSTTKTWGFHLPSGVGQPVAWLAAEFSGLQHFTSGVPRWDGGASSSGFTLNTASVSTGSSPGTTNAREALVAGFVDRVSSGTAPQSSSFTPNSFTRLGSTVTSANIRLDVGWRFVTALGSYECTASYASAPTGATGLLSGFWAV